MSFETTGPGIEVILFPIFLLAMLGLGVWGALWHQRRSDALLQRWADENGYELVKRERRYFRLGPFFWTTSRGQTVYYVTVRDRDGTLRTGWLRCGSWASGLLSDKTEVHWEEAGPSP